MAKSTKLPPFELVFTQSVCEVLAQTDYPGLTGAEIRQILEQVKVFELEEGPNKRTQLCTTLNNVMARQQAGNVLVAFINNAMSPTRFVSSEEAKQRWVALQAQLNERLIFRGLRINDEGKLSRTGKQAKTLSDAAELVGELSTELKRRGCHDQLFTYCREELISKSMFHAMSEAAKSIPDRIRKMTGMDLDGADLFQASMGSKNRTPQLFINDGEHESDWSAHKGFLNLLLGVHGHYRNPRAHSTRLGTNEDKADFYDAFALFSYIHRVLDKAEVRS